MKKTDDMPSLTFDTLKTRRALQDRTREVEALERRLKRTENARDALLCALSAMPDAIEIIGDDLLVHFANAASRSRCGAAPEQRHYYEALLGKEAPDEDCPVLAVLRDDQPRTVAIADTDGGGEIVVVPTMLSTGQRAVIRQTRPVSSSAQADEPIDTPANSQQRSMDLEALRDAALITAQSINTPRMIARCLPGIHQHVGATCTLFYADDEIARRFTCTAGEGDNETPVPVTLEGIEYKEFRNSIGIDAPFLRIDDIKTSTLPESLQEYFLRANIREVILIPAATRLARYGALLIGSVAPRNVVAFDDGKYLAALGQITGAAIERNRLVAALKKNVATAIDLQNAGMKVAATHDPEPAIAIIARTLVNVLGFSAVSAKIDSTGEAQPAFTVIYPERFSLPEPLAADIVEASHRVASRQAPEFIGADTSIRVNDVDNGARTVRCRCVAVFPVALDGYGSGVLQLFSDKKRDDVVAMQSALSPLIAHAGVAAGQSNVVKGLERALGEALTESSTIASLLDTIDEAAIVVSESGDIVRSNLSFDNMVGHGTPYRPALSELLFQRSDATTPSPLLSSAGHAGGAASTILFDKLHGACPVRGHECDVEPIDGVRVPVAMNASTLDIDNGASLLITFREMRTEIRLRRQLNAGKQPDDSGAPGPAA